MKTIVKPKTESKILASVSTKATKKGIAKDIIAKGECCVDPKCGCK